MPNFQKPDPREWLRRACQLADTENWVMDGNYLDTINCRMSRANALIWLDLPQPLYIARIIHRTMRNYGKERYDLGEGLPQKFQRELFRNAFKYPRFRKPQMQELIRRAELNGKIVIVLKSKREVDLFRFASQY